MALDIDKEVATLWRMTVAELQTEFAEVFGEPARCRHRVWLVRRIAWRRQALDEGGLSERARLRAVELANEADLRITAPDRRSAPLGRHHGSVGSALTLDSRLPTPGVSLTREYKGRTVEVKVLAVGFEYDGQIYASLSSVAKAITGSHWNGYHFFGLAKRGANP